MDETIYSWNSHNRSLELETGSSREFFVVDSWLADNGINRLIDRHKTRFVQTCYELLTIDTVDCEKFFDAALAAIPNQGQWFPRVQASNDGQLSLLVRPAPPLTQEVNMWVPSSATQRKISNAKGPDLIDLLALRQLAVERGGNEALLTSPEGNVLEGATTSVMWWRDEHTLCLPSDDQQLIPSVTRSFVIEHALNNSIDVVRENRKVEELDDVEVWTANALHGIRPVTNWIDLNLVARTSKRSAEWQNRWKQLVN